MATEELVSVPRRSTSASGGDLRRRSCAGRTAASCGRRRSRTTRRPWPGSRPRTGWTASRRLRDRPGQSPDAGRGLPLIRFLFEDPVDDAKAWAKVMKPSSGELLAAAADSPGRGVDPSSQAAIEATLAPLLDRFGGQSLRCSADQGGDNRRVGFTPGILSPSLPLAARRPWKGFPRRSNGLPEPPWTDSRAQMSG